MQCPNCHKALQGDFRFCPYCGAEVVSNTTCYTCHKQVEPAWVSCPYCGCDLKAPPARQPGKPVQRPYREQPYRGPEQHPYPPYSHGHYYGSSSAKYRKRKGFLGRLFS